MFSPLFFIILLEALAREICAKSPRELLYTDDLTWVSETIEDLTGRLEGWEGELQVRGLKVNVKKINDD